MDEETLTKPASSFGSSATPRPVEPVEQLRGQLDD
jgi:hypothetical protein